jgi:hypothetical protein
VVVLRAARIGWRREDDGALARRVRGGTGGLLFRLGEHTEGGDGGNGQQEGVGVALQPRELDTTATRSSHAAAPLCGRSAMT